MPRLATNYSNTVIYKIICKDKTVVDIYLGHTSNFTNRKNTHKSHSKNDRLNNKKIYVIINENGGWDNWDMIEVEKYPCNDANEAKAREKYWEDILLPTMNTNSTSFISYDGNNMDNIVGKDKKETNYLKALCRQRKLKEELDYLRKENKELKELLNKHLISY